MKREREPKKKKTHITATVPYEKGKKIKTIAIHKTASHSFIHSCVRYKRPSKTKRSERNNNEKNVEWKS